MDPLRKILPTQIRPPQPDYVPPTPTGCPQCGGVGWIFTERATPCECRYTTAMRTVTKANALTLPGNMGQRMTFQSFNPAGAPDASLPQQRSLATAKRRLTRWVQNPNGWIVITGATGTGKTHLAVATAAAVTASGISATFSTVAEVLNTLRRNARLEPDDTTLTQLQNTGLLVLDDMGAERSTAFAEEQLHLIIDYRYERVTPTIITTNLDYAALQSRRPRIASRMMDYRNTLQITIDAPDYRIRRQPEAAP